MKKFKVNWGIVINGLLTFATTVASAFTFYSCDII